MPTVLHWPLSGKATGLYMLIDGEWEEFFSTRLVCIGSHGYAIVRAPEGGQVLVHRLISGAARGEIVDHVNHDPLDNRRVNLRPGSRSTNNANKRLPVTRGTSWDPRLRKWTARGKVNGRETYLGSFTDRRDAIRIAHEWRLENLPGYEDSVNWEEMERALSG